MFGKVRLRSSEVGDLRLLARENEQNNWKWSDQGTLIGDFAEPAVFTEFHQFEHHLNCAMTADAAFETPNANTARLSSWGLFQMSDTTLEHCAKFGELT